MTTDFSIQHLGNVSVGNTLQWPQMSEQELKKEKAKKNLMYKLAIYRINYYWSTASSRIQRDENKMRKQTV